MLKRIALVSVRQLAQSQRRNIGVTAICYQKATTAANLDPIQKLFVDKIHAYDQKKKSGTLGTAEFEKQLQEVLEKVNKQYGATGPDFLKFPTFNFADPKLEPVGVDVTITEMEDVDVEGKRKVEEDEAEKPFWEV